MATVTVKAPSTIVQGAPFTARDGTSYTVGAGGLVTINTNSLNDALAAGFTIPTSFQAVTANVTANANTGQANAGALAYGINQVATAGAASASVALPAAVPGMFVTVVNDGANNVQVFGTGSDTVNGVAAATGVAQMSNSEVTYKCVVSGQWRCTPGMGFSGALNTEIAAGALVANTTGTLAGATALPAVFNRVATSGAANSAVQLPASAPGLAITMQNGAANAVGVFPQANEQIIPGSANAVFSVASNKTAQFTCVTAGIWHAILSA